MNDKAGRIVALVHEAVALGEEIPPPVNQALTCDEYFADFVRGVWQTTGAGFVVNAHHIAGLDDAIAKATNVETIVHVVERDGKPFIEATTLLENTHGSEHARTSDGRDIAGHVKAGTLFTGSDIVGRLAWVGGGGNSIMLDITAVLRRVHEPHADHTDSGAEREVTRKLFQGVVLGPFDIVVQE